MSTGLIPQNQIDALPGLGLPFYAAQNGDLEIAPKTFQRYFDPVRTGINNWIGNLSDPVTGHFRAYTLEMNCRGCRHFTFTLAVKMREAANDSDFRPDVYATAWAAAEPGVRVAPLIDNFNLSTWVKVGTMRLQPAYQIFPGPVLGVYPVLYKTAACSWDVGGLGNAGFSQDGLTGSLALRLDAPNGIPGGAFFNAELYGSLIAAT